ncbi:MAG: hypothetical protein LBU32_07535 [Clostridiales bacterium]|jgi:hypothetical protein|nr:hypothetical protein [Clostridiales bacterium]
MAARPAIWVDISEPLIGSDWATAKLEKADELGLIPDTLKGADLTKPITRAEFEAVSVKAYEKLGNTTAIPVVNNPFTDTTDIEAYRRTTSKLPQACPRRNLSRTPY